VISGQCTRFQSSNCTATSWHVTTRCSAHCRIESSILRVRGVQT
jgi:hypothetical protein